MESSDILDVLSESMVVLLQVSGPIMLVSLVVGLIIALFQALTQIQEITLTFVPKIFAVFLSMLFLGPYMMSVLEAFAQVIADRIIGLGS
ncbi:MAG: flagellar biosynthesis protein FliQ [Pseudomonadota bacterium]